MRVCCSEHKLQVVGRLFQRFEHGIESRVRQHVHLVDHEDLEAPDNRFVDGLLQQLGNLIDTPV